MNQRYTSPDGLADEEDVILPKPSLEKIKAAEEVEDDPADHADADERVDEAIDESFPASDPPSWNAGLEVDPN